MALGLDLKALDLALFVCDVKTRISREAITRHKYRDVMLSALFGALNFLERKIKTKIGHFLEKRISQIILKVIAEEHWFMVG